MAASARSVNEELAVNVGRGFAGALLFSLPMLMTMEMWSLGFTVKPERLALLLLVTVPLLVRLSRYGGLRETQALKDDLADALVAVAIAVAASSLLLWVFGELSPSSSAHEVVGKIAVQAVPGSIGAVLARNQLGSNNAQEDLAQVEATYGGELLLMVVGALFLSLNVAPTEEVVLIAYQMPVAAELGLAALSIAFMHGFVYSFEFQGTEHGRPGEGFFALFLRFTVVGYVLVLAVNLYALWTFGRLEGLVPSEALSAMIVLGLPGSVGAAAARLLL